MKLDDLPFLKETALHVGYDGIIHRGYIREDYLDHCESCINADGVYESDMRILDQWLSNLTPDQRITVACGEMTDMARINATCPTNNRGEWLVAILDDFGGDDK